ncbi:hypothetical protein Gotri_027984 [Gossypium trilobum]|uniref:RNase H type-1 domain-containing protein n=1 Tax=Gossypium trilobum TaxID=34281 RepID=A0A7J9FHW0_9ROSI|nr:hypothetical protein [Gossypium trilobum]
MVETKGWIHLKTDGVVEINIGCDAARGGIVYGVALVQRRQHDKILVQTDNMEVIGAIKEALSMRSNSAIIQRITQLLQGVENWSIEHVLREDNAEANHIAKLAFDRGEGFQLYIVSPLDSF